MARPHAVDAPNEALKDMTWLDKARRMLDGKLESWGSLANEVLDATGDAVHSNHEVASGDDWPWLPSTPSGILARHAYCVGCGLVRAHGADRARDLGGLVNLLGRLGDALRQGGHRITQVQRRVVLQRLRQTGADDGFGLTRTSQLRVVTQAVARTLGLSENVVATYLRSC